MPTRPDSDYGTIMWHTWQVIPAGCSLYTDGSLIDARLGLGLEALGWAFAAFDAGGNVVAAAYGVPPRDADTTQGAELWALKQALTFVPFPVVIYVDCKTVVDGIRSGQQWIYSPKGNALANAWPGIDGEPLRDSTGMPQGARRGKKRRQRASIEAGKDDVVAPGTVELPKENVTAWPRPSPTPSLAAARSRSLREAAARAEARSEASFSEWWRQSRYLRMSQTPVDCSRRLSASERLDALRRRRGIPVQDA